MTDKLKTCPFCGGDAHMAHAGDYFTVTCGFCGATIRISGHEIDNFGADAMEGVAINEWNRRDDADYLTKSLEKCRARADNAEAQVRALRNAGVWLARATKDILSRLQCADAEGVDTLMSEIEAWEALGEEERK